VKFLNILSHDKRIGLNKYFSSCKPYRTVVAYLSTYRLTGVTKSKNTPVKSVLSCM